MDKIIPTAINDDLDANNRIITTTNGERAAANTAMPNGHEQIIPLGKITTIANLNLNNNNNVTRANNSNSRTTTTTDFIRIDVSFSSSRSTRRPFPLATGQQQQQQQQQSNGGYQGGNRERRNSTGGMTGNQQRNHRQRADSTRGNANNQSALKFIGDFDFEKSNAEFDKNAIEDEIKKSLSIKTSKDKTEESTPTEQQQKENVPAEQNSALIQLTSGTTAEKPDPQDQDANADGFYDKQRSFFDRISCETTEKEKTCVDDHSPSFEGSFFLLLLFSGATRVAIGTKNVV